MNLRELNRTLLLRQLLLKRQRMTVAKAVAKLVALQAQYAPSPYVALWARLDGVSKAQVDRAKASSSGMLERVRFLRQQAQAAEK